MHYLENCFKRYFFTYRMFTTFVFEFEYYCIIFILDILFNLLRLILDVLLFNKLDSTLTISSNEETTTRQIALKDIGHRKIMVCPKPNWITSFTQLTRLRFQSANVQRLTLQNDLLQELSSSINAQFLNNIPIIWNCSIHSYIDAFHQVNCETFCWIF